MKKIVQKIYQNHYFLLFILLFAYLQSIYTRIAVRQLVNVYTFTPEAALASLLGAGILFLIIIFFIKIWHTSNTLNTKIMVKIFGFSLFSYVLSMQLIGFLIALIFDKIEQNFNQQTFVLSLFSDFLDGFIYGSFFLAYYYYNNNKKYQQQLTRYNQVLSEAKINQLKTQLNPHFLFNNLNVLDQLIDEDKYKASDFLNEFAEIYRYVLQVSDKELVTISEEINFAKQYFQLIAYKYGNTYQLNIENGNTEGFVVPLTLQLLIENATKHNHGKVERPIRINVILGKNIVVSNNINLKRQIEPKSGRALKNLKEQYQLLTTEVIRIEQNESFFTVTVPIITS